MDYVYWPAVVGCQRWVIQVESGPMCSGMVLVSMERDWWLICELSKSSSLPYMYVSHLGWQRGLWNS